MSKTQIDQEIELSEFVNGPWAFTTDYFSKKIILGFGGEIKQSNHLPHEDCFFLKDFFNDSYQVYFPRKLFSLDQDYLSKVINDNNSIGFKSSSNTDDFYSKDFNRLKESFSENLKKVVLISREEFVSKEDTKKVVQRLLSKCFCFNSGNPYGFSSNEFGMIGNTPEFLYAIEKSIIYTHALAGSAKIEDANFLLSSSKDLKEHQIVIQDILEKLKNICDDLKAENTELISFKKMVHLKTPISGRLHSEWNHEKLISLLSPTAALGGYPTNIAVDFLKNSSYQKNYPKRFFGSAFGFKSQRINQVMVAIRNIQWDQSKYWIESGGGVVSESIFENELNEIKLKRNIIKEHYLCQSP